MSGLFQLIGTGARSMRRRAFRRRGPALVRYQHAYEASARYITSVNDMIQSLIGVL